MTVDSFLLHGPWRRFGEEQLRVTSVVRLESRMFDGHGRWVPYVEFIIVEQRTIPEVHDAPVYPSEDSGRLSVFAIPRGHVGGDGRQDPGASPEDPAAATPDHNAVSEDEVEKEEHEMSNTISLRSDQNLRGEDVASDGATLRGDYGVTDIGILYADDHMRETDQDSEHDDDEEDRGDMLYSPVECGDDTSSDTSTLRGDDEMSDTTTLRGDDEMSDTTTLRGDDEMSDTSTPRGDGEMPETTMLCGDDESSDDTTLREDDQGSERGKQAEEAEEAEEDEGEMSATIMRLDSDAEEENRMSDTEHGDEDGTHTPLVAGEVELKVPETPVSDGVESDDVMGEVFGDAVEHD